MSIDFDPKTAYLNYISQNQIEISPAAVQQLTQVLDNCQWEQPQTALDWNNRAVAALVAAESCDNSLTHGLYAEIAFDGIQAGFELNQHPLCAAHLALLNCMLGNYSDAAQIAFSAFINNLQPTYTEAEIEPGIVYIPTLTHTHVTNGRSEQLQRILNTENGYVQAMLMLTEVLCRTQIDLDNQTGIRLLHLMNQLMPDLISPNIRLGIYSIGNRALEGLVYLHRAGELALDHPIVIQSLYLAYRDLEQPELANYWQQIGLDYGSQRLAKSPWQWTHLSIDHDWTYIPFDSDILLAVPASLQSPTTRCLLAEGDWFERELEFWRQYLQPDMNIIDIGASMGIYTFSAARRVGIDGMVYAIEPSTFAADCLDQTCRINQLENVKVFRNAVGDFDCDAQLALQASSEASYLLARDEQIALELETTAVNCITIDTFVQQAAMDSPLEPLRERIDLIKISTEGNELAVLIGGKETIAKFAPTIIYNSYTSKGVNLAAAEYLIDRGYELFRYQPYLQQLIPLVNEGDFAEVVKVIAIPQPNS